MIADITVDDDSKQVRALMWEDYLELYFDMEAYVDFPVGSYCTFEGVDYTLNVPAQIEKINTFDLRYTLRMEAPGSKAQSVIVQNRVDRRVSFDLTATPREHLALIVSNLNRESMGWTIGDCISETEKLVTYDHTDCMSALKVIADTFNTEFEIAGKVISLHRVEYNKEAPLQMQYGKNNGFLTGIRRINQEGTPPPDFIYPQGSDRNISLADYGYATLRLPRNATLGYDGSKFSDQIGFDTTKAKYYTTDADGLYVAKESSSRISNAERSLDCTEIYPSRVGEVTDIYEDVSGSNVYYNFDDTTIPSTLDFSAYTIAGTTMVVVFQSGMLAGREIEISEYDHTNRLFKMAPTEIDGVTMPGGDWLPRVGDTYVVLNINMPSDYINSGASHGGAEWVMLRKCIAYLYDNGEYSYTFSGDVDQIWAKTNWSSVGGYMAIGEHIRFVDEQFHPSGILLRVTGITQRVNSIHKIELTLSNTTKKSDFLTRFDTIRNEVSRVGRVDISSYRRTSADQTVIKKTLFGNERVVSVGTGVVPRLETLESKTDGYESKILTVEEAVEKLKADALKSMTVPINGNKMTVNHNLDRYPTVTAKTASGAEYEETLMEVVFESRNTVRVIFHSEELVEGYLYLV